MNRLYVDAYGGYGLGHLVRSKTIIESFGNYKIDINRFFAKKSKIAIVDSYQASYLDYYNISKVSKVALFMDDFFRMNYPKKGLVVNFSFEAVRKRRNNNQLFGAKFVPIRKEFLSQKKEPRHILIMMGGYDHKNLSFQLERIDLPYKKIVVTSNKEVAKKCENVLLSPSVEQISKVMADSILAVSAAGMTLYELNYLQIPTIAIKVAPNQKGVYQFKKRGFIKDIFNYDDNVVSFVKSSIYWHLNNYDKAMKYTNKLVDGKGVSRIKKRVEEYL